MMSPLRMTMKQRYGVPKIEYLAEFGKMHHASSTMM